MKHLEYIEHTLQRLASPKRAHTFWGWVLVMMIAAVFLWIRNSSWIDNPNAWLLRDSTDSYKNYMTSAWHVKYDAGYVHYSGMDYPYGEHVLFTDNQPIISGVLRWWSLHVSDISGDTTGILNLLQVWSLIFGAGIIYLLFRKLHFPVWYATMVSLGVLFLSPQCARFDVHFGLSHTWVFPLLLLLLCRYEERHSRRYQSLQIGILLWVAAQIHFYYFGLSALFLLLYTAYQLWIDPSLRNFRVRLSHLVVMILLPFALLNVWIHWADFRPDRPATPYGFTGYIGFWEGVFLPYENFPMYQWIDGHIAHIRRLDSESQAYAGLVAFGFTLWLIFSGVFRRAVRRIQALFKKDTTPAPGLFPHDWELAAYHRVHKRYLQGILAAALALLIFACGFPYAIHGLEWIADYFGPLRQFRGMGRFTWAFYYVINLVAFYWLWNWSIHFKGFKGHTNLWFRWVIALLPLAVLGYEAWYFHHSRPLQIENNPMYPPEQATFQDKWLEKVDYKPYQAMLPLPYYHVGSENLWLDMDFALFRKVQLTGFVHGLPDMGVNMSRSSIGQMLKSVQLTLPPGEVPQILADLPDNRPLLLFTEQRLWDTVQRQYPYLLDKAVPVYTGTKIRLLAVSPDSIQAAAAERIRAMQTEAANEGIYPAGRYKSDRPPGFFHLQTFDSLTTTEHIFQGKGAFSGNMHDTTWLWNAPLPKGNYHLGFWIDVKQDMGMVHALHLVENAVSDGHEIQAQDVQARFHLKEIVGDWALFDIPVSVKEDNSSMRVYLLQKGINTTFYLDEVLLRADGFNLYHTRPGWVAKNNFWYKTDLE
ncbi:MAG: hypothetical protein LCH81_20860 [Bacteroidetes bacterium]|nr:hypothetical protein [Bacteroidota bacterium]